MQTSIMNRRSGITKYNTNAPSDRESDGAMSLGWIRTDDEHPVRVPVFAMDLE